MPLLDFFQNPNVSLAAGLLSPTKDENFGQGLLQGIRAGQGTTAANSIDQLRRLQAQIEQRRLDAVQQPESLIGKANPSNFTPESVQAFSRSRDFSDLERVPDAPQIVQNIGGAGPLVTLDVPQPDGTIKKRTLRRDNPEVNTLLADDATEEGATALSTVEVNSLSNVGGKFTQLQKLSDSFEDSFSSTIPGFAAGENILGQKFDFGDVGAQSDWWRNYQSLRNEVRNSLFGGALTPTEAEEFLKEDINTGMKSERIRNKLQSQLEIVSGALNRQAGPLAAGGKSRSQINSALGGDVLGRRFFKLGETINKGGKKFRVIRPGIDPEVEEVK